MGAENRRTAVLFLGGLWVALERNAYGYGPVLGSMLGGLWVYFLLVAFTLKALGFGKRVGSVVSVAHFRLWMDPLPLRFS